MRLDNLRKYEQNLDKIPGWCRWDTLRKVYNNIYRIQANIPGDILEIGVYCGKSLIPLAAMTKDSELCIGVDLFSPDLYFDGDAFVPNLMDEHYPYEYNNIKVKEQLQSLLSEADQELVNNTTCRSTIYMKNVEVLIKNMIDKQSTNVKLLQYDSQAIQCKDILQHSNTKFRIISIDGCHNYDCVLHDLRLANQMLTDQGILIIDDYGADIFNLWPGVRMAVDMFLNQHYYQPMVVAGNKLFLCRSGAISTYKRLYKLSYPPHDSMDIKFLIDRHKIAKMWKNVKRVVDL
jgi:hypothetical protein